MWKSRLNPHPTGAESRTRTTLLRVELYIVCIPYIENNVQLEELRQIVNVRNINNNGGIREYLALSEKKTKNKETKLLLEMQFNSNI